MIAVEKIARAPELPQHLTIFVFQPQIDLGDHKDDGDGNTIIYALGQNVPQHALVDKREICAHIFGANIGVGKVVV